MIRKQREYDEALILRKKGKSIRQIAKLVGISPSTASSWCGEVVLTEYQKESLKRSKARINHLRGLARQSHLEKIARVKRLFRSSKGEIKKLNTNELFLVGTALYWAEGFKSLKEARLGFCNSDPRMIKFMIRWFNKSLNVAIEDLILRAEFNESHIDREEQIKMFWSKTTGIPLSQFEKSFHHRSTWLREYSNKDTYFGVLRIRVRRSSELLNKMRGWISGLSLAI